MRRIVLFAAAASAAALPAGSLRDMEAPATPAPVQQEAGGGALGNLMTDLANDAAKRSAEQQRLADKNLAEMAQEIKNRQIEASARATRNQGGEEANAARNAMAVSVANAQKANGVQAGVETVLQQSAEGFAAGMGASADGTEGSAAAGGEGTAAAGGEGVAAAGGEGTAAADGAGTAAAGGEGNVATDGGNPSATPGENAAAAVGQSVAALVGEGVAAVVGKGVSAIGGEKVAGAVSEVVGGVVAETVAETVEAAGRGERIKFKKVVKGAARKLSDRALEKAAETGAAASGNAAEGDGGN